jgi:hypothetical protein
MRITSNGELDFYTLFQNESISMYSCFKDKYNNKFIKNNKVNIFDNETNTFYYVFETDFGFNRGITYFKTSDGSVLRTTFDPYYGGRFTNPITFPLSAKIVGDNGALRDLSVSDNFDVFSSSISQGFYDVYNVVNGLLYGYLNTNIQYFWLFELTINNSVDSEYKRFAFESSPYVGPFYNTELLKEYNIILEFSDRKLYYYKDFWEGVRFETESRYFNIDGSLHNISNFSQSRQLLLEDIDIEDGKLLRYGLNSNTHYEIIPEIENGQLVLNSYITGTYVAPPTITITLQPVNR